MRRDLDEYLQNVVRHVHSALPGLADGIVVGGSIAFDDFYRAHSDVDVTLFLRTEPTETQLATLESLLEHRTFPCPGKGLDLLAFASASAGVTPPVPEAIFSFVTGETWRTVLSGPERSDDFLIDLFVLRERGRSLYGPPPRQLVGDVVADTIRSRAVQVIQWHRTRIHDPFHDPTGAFAVLNACRAWRFVAEGVMDSKTAGGKWAIERLGGAEIVEAALALRRGARRDRLPRHEVLKFLIQVGDYLRETL